MSCIDECASMSFSPPEKSVSFGRAFPASLAQSYFASFLLPDSGLQGVPGNQVARLARLVRFGESGTILSVGTLGGGNASSCTTELWLKPARRRGSELACFYAGDWLLCSVTFG